MLSEVQVRRRAGLAAIVQALVLAFMIAGTHGWIVSGVRANTTDYVSFWAAGRLADQGQAALAYDHAAHLRMEEAASAPGIEYEYFFNPPPFLLIMAPLAWLPYLVSFVVFEGATLALWLVAGTRAAGGRSTATLCLLAVSSLWWVLGLGQNSFLTAGLMGCGLLALPRRKWLAGLAFGLLCYKPHLALLIPVALAAGGEWVAMLAASLCVAVMLASTVALFGWRVWAAYLRAFGQDLAGPINGGRVLLTARVDPVGAAQQLGLGLTAGHAIWGVCLVCAVVCVWVGWRRPVLERGRNMRGVSLAAGAILGAPFALFYDLVLCSLAAAWLAGVARRDGWRRGEPAALIGLAVVCLLAAPPVVRATHIPFGALAAPALLGLSFKTSSLIKTGGLRGGGLTYTSAKSPPAFPEPPTFRSPVIKSKTLYQSALRLTHGAEKKTGLSVPLAPDPPSSFKASPQ